MSNILSDKNSTIMNYSIVNRKYFCQDLKNCALLNSNILVMSGVRNEGVDKRKRRLSYAFKEDYTHFYVKNFVIGNA